MSELEIYCPITGQCAGKGDVDALLEIYERLEDKVRVCTAAMSEIRQAIGEIAKGNTKTRRVRGKHLRAVVTMPDDKWDQSILKEAYLSYPALREQCLKIGVIDVRLREWNKMKNETGPDDFETFKRMIASANKGPLGLPRITIEAAISSTEAKQAEVDAAQEPLEEGLF